jgi:hypothetical protein
VSSYGDILFEPIFIRSMRVVPFFFVLAALSLLSARGEDEAPLTRILDTVTPSTVPTFPDTLNVGSIWIQLPEDRTNHLFSGDAVLRNDKLAVVLPKKLHEVQVFSKTATGLKHRATLGFLATNSSPCDSLEGLEIVENTAAGVSVGMKSKDGGVVRFRLTTGEATLEIQPGEASGFVELRSRVRYVAVPDYFGDDLVYSAEAARDLCLPAENFCLNLIDSEEAMIMSVWQSNEQEAWLGRSAGAKEPGLPSVRLRSLKNQKIWLAFLESPGTWHQGTSLADANWKPPFPAKWRASFARDHSLADSWDLEKGPDPEQTAAKHGGPLVVYPLDRSVATPLTATCVTDVMRNTLGVGPCQYILSCEGLGAQGDPTPNSVMNWVEKQFEQKKQKKAADDISDRLQVMNQHVADARARIERYAAFTESMRKSLRSGQDAFQPVLDSLGQITASGLAAAAGPERSRQLTSQVLALVAKDNGLEECRRLGQELRAIGAVQDHTLAKCRMAVRRLRAQACSLAVNQPQEAKSAQLIQGLAEQMLRNK